MAGMHNGRRIIDISEVQRLAGVSRRTVYHWIATGKIHRLEVASGRARFYEDEVLLVEPQRQTRGALPRPYHFEDATGPAGVRQEERR